MGIYVIVALRNLLQARRRSLLLSLALAMVTMLLVMLLALSQGLTDNMVKTATTLSSGHVNVSGFFKLTPGMVSPIITEAAPVRKVIEENTPELDFMIDRIAGFGKLIGDSGSTLSSLSGIEPANEARFIERIQLAPEKDYKEGGRDVIEGDRSKIGQDGTILIFTGHAKRLGVGIGDTVTISAETFGGVANTADLTVVAIAKDMGMMSNWFTFVSKKTIRDLYQVNEATTGGYLLYLKDIEDTDAVRARLDGIFKEKGFEVLDYDPGKPFFVKFEPLASEGWTGQRLDITTWEDEGAFLKWTIAGFDAVSIFLIGILTMIIVVGIMNTMWMSVRERTSEVGTLRAIGMKKRRVLALFVIEALILGLVATAAGSLMGAALSSLLNLVEVPIPSEAARMIVLSDTLYLSLRGEQLVKAVLLFTVVTGLAALWPASRAARMRPVSAIQHVG